MHVKQMLDATLVNAHINLTEDKCVIIIGLKYTQHITSCFTALESQWWPLGVRRLKD